MNAATLDRYRRRLERELVAAVGRVVKLERDLDDMAAELDVETMDRIQEEVAAGVLSKLEEKDRLQAEDVQAALARIQNGTYGRCEACGHEIAANRLRALPTARRCAACQALIEARAD